VLLVCELIVPCALLSAGFVQQEHGWSLSRHSQGVFRGCGLEYLGPGGSTCRFRRVRCSLQCGDTLLRPLHRGTLVVSRLVRQLVNPPHGAPFSHLYHALVLQITLILQSCRLQWRLRTYDELQCECCATVGIVRAPVGVYVHMCIHDPYKSMQDVCLATFYHSSMLGSTLA